MVAGVIGDIEPTAEGKGIFALQLASVAQYKAWSDNKGHQIYEQPGSD